MNAGTTAEQREPWRDGQVTVVIVANVAALLVVAFGVYQAAGVSTVARQIPWMNIAVLGTALLIAANVLFIRSVRRAVGSGVTTLRLGLHRGGSAFPLPIEQGATALAPRSGEMPVASESMRWYHQPTCPLVASKETKPASAADHARSGRRPCGVCRP